MWQTSCGNQFEFWVSDRKGGKRIEIARQVSWTASITGLHLFGTTFWHLFLVSPSQSKTCVTSQR